MVEIHLFLVMKHHLIGHLDDIVTVTTQSQVITFSQARSNISLNCILLIVRVSHASAPMAIISSNLTLPIRFEITGDFVCLGLGLATFNVPINNSEYAYVDVNYLHEHDKDALNFQY